MNGQRPNRRTNPVRGLLLLAIGRREGFALFGTDSRAYLNSLAPLVALILVLGGLTMLAGNPIHGAAGFFASLSSLLTPAVIAEALCQRWNRLPYWALFANLLNWMQILLVGVLALALLLALFLASAGLSAMAAASVMVLIVLGYVTWFQWFTARGALHLTRMQTVVLLLAIQLGMGVLLVLQVETGLLPLMPAGFSAQLQG